MSHQWFEQKTLLIEVCPDHSWPSNDVSSHVEYKGYSSIHDLPRTSLKAH